MNAYELRIRELDDPISFATARWELLAFPEVRDLLRTSGAERFIVLYEGQRHDIERWCEVLDESGHPALPIRRIDAIDSAALSADAQHGEQFFKPDPRVGLIHLERRRRSVTDRRSPMKYLIKAAAALAATAAIALIVAALADASAAKTGRTTVAVAKSPFGPILVDSKGITLYDFVQDKGTMSTCYGASAALWPPVLTTGKPLAGPGVRASLLGTTRRKDGKLEVTYKGHPLYYFVTDRKPGQTTGQGVNQFGAPWWVLSPAGKEIHHV
jgi:predicted lipoprotein with Yx(FWY)xxD motif